jgi:hypothetical protein
MARQSYGLIGREKGVGSSPMNTGIGCLSISGAMLR